MPRASLASVKNVSKVDDHYAHGPPPFSFFTKKLFIKEEQIAAPISTKKVNNKLSRVTCIQIAITINMVNLFSSAVSIIKMP